MMGDTIPLRRQLHIVAIYTPEPCVITNGYTILTSLKLLVNVALENRFIYHLTRAEGIGNHTGLWLTAERIFASHVVHPCSNLMGREWQQQQLTNGIDDYLR